MLKNNLVLARYGENEAAAYLKANGYRILERNFRTPLGELDIIALDKSVVCFVEVKARSSEDFGSPKEAVSSFKQRQIAKAALVFLKDRKLLDRSSRFDVVSVIMRGGKPEIELIKDAFELDHDFSL